MASLLGSLLNIKPVIRVQRGEAVTLDKARRFDRAVERLIERLREAGGWAGMCIGVLHTAMAAESEELHRHLQGMFHGAVETVVREAGPVLGAHIGPGALAVALVPPHPYPLSQGRGG